MTTKTSKTSKSNQTQPTANEEPHTTASVAEPGATVASPKAASKKVTRPKKKAAQGHRKAPGKAIKTAKSAKVSAPSQPRQSGKKTNTPEAPQHPRAPVGLLYGAFDFLRTPEGELVFLEINPTGEWAWLEDRLRFPMRDAFIQLFYGDRP
jgi:hypothetical protein